MRAEGLPAVLHLELDPALGGDPRPAVGIVLVEEGYRLLPRSRFVPLESPDLGLLPVHVPGQCQSAAVPEEQEAVYEEEEGIPVSEGGLARSEPGFRVPVQDDDLGFRISLCDLDGEEGSRRIHDGLSAMKGKH